MKKSFFSRLKNAWENYEIGQIRINGRAYHGSRPGFHVLKSIFHWLIAVAIII